MLTPVFCIWFFTDFKSLVACYVRHGRDSQIAAHHPNGLKDDLIIKLLNKGVGKQKT